MKRFLLILIALLVSAPVHAAEKETAYERVIRTNTIRCGYALWKPMLIHDAETKSFSGLYYDLLEEIGRRLSLKVEWTEEAPLDMILEGLSSGRYDAVCFPLYETSGRARASFFSEPLFYLPVYLVTRQDDTRFDQDIMILNDQKYRIAQLDGEFTAILAQQKFPNATRHAIPQAQGFGFVLKDVAMKKADATISDIVSVSDFNKENEEKLRTSSAPLLVNGAAFPLPQDPRLKAMIDSTIREILNEGWLENTIKTKYPDVYQTIKMPTTPYRLEK